MNSDTLNNILNAKSNVILVWTMTVLFLIFLTFQIKRISSKEYLTSENDLQRIENVNVRTRAYFHQGSGRGGSTMIEFDNTKGDNLRISGSSYSATKDRSQLYDTLLHYGTVMTVYILKEDVAEYYDDNFDRIDLYGIEIGSNSYLNVQNLNNEEHGKRYNFLIFVSVCYWLFLIIHFMRVKRIWKKT